MKLECIGFVNFQPENIRQGIYGLVTIVLERAWAALKCDQLPVMKSHARSVVFQHLIAVRVHVKRLELGLLSHNKLLSLFITISLFIYI